MSDDNADSGRRQIGPRTLLLCMVAGMLLSAGVMAFTGNTGDVPVSDDVPLRSPDGVTLTVDNGGDQLQSGNPFVATNAIQFRNTTFIGASGATAANLSVRNNTFVGIGSLSGDRMVINHSFTSYRYGAEPGLQTLEVNKSALNLSQSSSHLEARYVTGSQPTIDLLNTKVSDGRGVVARAVGSGTILDASAADTAGNIRFDDLPTGDIGVNFELGAADLRIYNKSSPSTLVTQTLRVRFFDSQGNLVREVETSDGKVDLDGLDQSASYTIRIKDIDSSNPEYRSASITPNKLIEQSTAYLQPVQAPAAYVTFKLDDQSGQFPGDETLLIIEEIIRKDFDGDGNVESKYQQVAGGGFGSDNRRTDVLADNEDFRLSIDSTSATRQMGTYHTNGNDTVTLQIDDFTLGGNQSDLSVDTGYALTGSITTLNGQRFIQLNYRDPENITNSFEYRARFRENGTVFEKDTLSGPLGEATVYIDISNHSNTTNYRVDAFIERNYTTVSESLYFGQAGPVNLPLDSRWTGILGMVLIVAAGGLAVILSSAAGALTMTVVAALLTAVGIVSIPSAAVGMSGGIVVLALMGRG